MNTVFGFLVVATGASVVAAGVIAGATLWRGLVLSYLWAWFMVPLGLPPLTVLGAAGVSLVAISLFPPPALSVKDKSLGEIVWPAFSAPAFSLGIGWAVRQWM